MSHNLAADADSIRLVSPSPLSSPLSLPNLLSPNFGSLLLVADCVGTGLLALPCFTSLLGGPLPTFAILTANFIINYYAGVRLLHAAVVVEDRDISGALCVKDLPSLAACLKTHTIPTNASFNTNLFLVLGAYLLTMESCLTNLLYPWTPPKVLLGSLCVGVLISFNFTVGRTMSNLGRLPSVISISTILTAIVICLYTSLSSSPSSSAYVRPQTYGFSVLAAIAGVAFAVGSQKLLLNVRSELQDTNESPRVLANGLLIYFILYTVIIFSSPRDAPGMFLDILEIGSLRSRFASACLLLHVGVSFSINSQALVRGLVEHEVAGGRWWVVNALVATGILLITIIIPFFASLTSLIGALTSIPLTLTLPIIFGASTEEHRSRWRLRLDILLVYVCGLLTILGTVASIWKIVIEWGV